jgi:hypothetical protein
MRTEALTTAIAADPNSGADMVALTKQRLAELDRLRDAGFVQLGRLNETTRAIPKDQLFGKVVGPKGTMAEFDRFSRAIRQIMVLEFELRGLFKAPDRDAPRKLRLVKSDRPGFVPPERENLFADLERLEDLLDIRTDYRRGPMDEVVAGIRETLGAEPPPNDPFAPSAEKVPEPVAPAAPPKGPEYYMRARTAEPAPVPAQKAPAMKAATLVIETLAGKGFRTPSKAAIKKHRQGRGPPK